MSDASQEDAKLEVAIQTALDRRKLDFYKPYPKQRLFHDLGATHSDRLLMAGNQLGKQLHDDTPVLTPTGWVRIADLKVGDEVIAGDGTATTVTGVFPQGINPLYKLTFDRGESVLAGLEHQWKFMHPKDRYPTRFSHGKWEPVPTCGQWTVGSTGDLLKICRSHPIPRRRALIPHVPPVQFQEQKVPLDPYVLGLLLGDGCLRSHVMFSTADPELVSAIELTAAQFGLTIRRERGLHYHLSAPGGRGHGRGGFGAGNPLKKVLEELGVFGKLSYDKFVPKCYLFNTPEIRLAMLQGLMDTDGSAQKSGAIEFSTTSAQLAKDITFLVQSFGGKVANFHKTRRTRFTANDGSKQLGAPSWRLRIRLPHVPVFRLTRKLDRCFTPTSTCDERVLWSIEPAGEGPATCISVAHPDKTFVVEHFLVTHNTLSAAAETAIHATGQYPKWWKGRRFDEPVVGWVAGATSQTTRDNPQRLLLGQVGEWGTGMIPANAIVDIKKAIHGVAESVETVLVRHQPTSRISRITFKTYDQGRERWQGETLHFVWFDEEPPLDIYSEGKTRCQVKSGITYMTFTPLLGMSEVVLRFLKEKPPGSTVITMTIHEALHYTKEQREAIIAGYPEHEREARAMGTPMLGSGAVFPVQERLIKEGIIQIPGFWPRICGMDIGWDHPTAAVWIAWDRDADIIHVYDAYKLEKQTPIVHAAAIKARGGWIPVAWPHDSLQHDKGSGVAIANQYRKLGVRMLIGHATHPPEKGKKEGSGGYSLEAGIQDMLQRMQTGRFKVAEHLNDWFEEYRLYHRKDGLVVKEHDDLMSATRVGVMMLRHARIMQAAGTTPNLPRFECSDASMGVLG